MERAAITVLDEFRSGTLGRLTLELRGGVTMARTAVPQFDLYGYDAEKRQQFAVALRRGRSRKRPTRWGCLCSSRHSLAGTPAGGAERQQETLRRKNGNCYFRRFRSRQLPYCIATASVAEIEAYNILGATMLAMQRAVAGLSVQPDARLD